MTDLEAAYAWLRDVPKSPNPEFRHLILLVQDFTERLTAIEKIPTEAEAVTASRPDLDKLFTNHCVLHDRVDCQDCDPI